MLLDQTLDQKNQSLVQDLDLDPEKIEDKNNRIKLQNYGITKDEITGITGIIVIETIITNLTTGMIEEAAEEEEADLIVAATKETTTEIILGTIEAIIDKITIEDTTTTTIIIKITMKKTIANSSTYPKQT